MYIACSLSHVPRALFEEYSKFIHSLAAAIRTHPPGHEVKYALVNSDPQLATRPIQERARLCYRWDREMVEEAELIVAEASFPSTGLGIELQIAQQKNIPVVLCFRDFGQNKAEPVEYVNPDASHHQLQIGDGFVSLMALGLPTITNVIRYRDTEDGVSQVLGAVGVLDRRS